MNKARDLCLQCVDAVGSINQSIKKIFIVA